jgi:hypothetical protein
MTVDEALAAMRAFGGVAGLEGANPFRTARVNADGPRRAVLPVRLERRSSRINDAGAS